MHVVTLYLPELLRPRSQAYVDSWPSVQYPLDKTWISYMLYRRTFVLSYTCHVEDRAKCHALSGNVNGIWLYPSHVIHTWKSSFHPVYITVQPSIDLPDNILSLTAGNSKGRVRWPHAYLDLLHERSTFQKWRVERTQDSEWTARWFRTCRGSHRLLPDRTACSACNVSYSWCYTAAIKSVLYTDRVASKSSWFVHPFSTCF